jgi:hypothetical protein
VKELQKKYHVLSSHVDSIALHINTVASLRSVVFLYKGEQYVNVARRIGVVACNWIMAPTKRGVADESRICKDNWSSTPFFTETVGTACLVLSVREAFLE